MENQTIQNFKVNIFNNSGQKLDWGDFPAERINIINSEVNQGSAARFKLVPETKGEVIIFFDDDEVLQNDFVEYHYELYKKNPNAIQGWFSKIFDGKDYWHAKKLLPAGTEVDYVGTGGMVVGRKIFDEEPILQNIPEEFAKTEDLFLSFVAKKRGMKILSAEQKCSIIVDKKDQYAKIVDYKNKALESLKDRGYPLVVEECSICGYQGDFTLFRKKDEWHPHDEYHCPKCKSLSRHRFIWRSFKNLGFKKMLHVSPERCLMEKLRPLGEYVSIDLPPRESESGIAKADICMDLRKTTFKRNEFDFIICNHVLDQIEDDYKAIHELYRIVNHSGIVLISVPIYKGEQTKKLDKPVNNHWWRCGMDWFDRLQLAGFKVELAEHDNEIFAVCRKNLRIDLRSEIDANIIREETSLNIYRVKNPKVVVDIGAHIGGTALFCGIKGAEVYAYEPELDNYRLLEKNVKGNDFQDQIHIFNKAVGTAGKRELNLHMENDGCHSFYPNIAPNMSDEKQEIETISIQEVFKDIPHCDLLKIDCEGAEYEFLKDIPFKKIDQISMELHDTGNQREALNLLNKHYKVEHKLAADKRSLMVYCTR